MKIHLVLIFLYIFLVSCQFNVSPKTKEANIQGNPSSTEYVSFTSNYFKGDENVDFSQLTFGHDIVNKNSFSYKTLNGLRMIGYSFEFDKHNPKPVYAHALELFKTNSNITLDSDPNTETVTKETLIALDSKIKVLEEKNSILAHSFPLHSYVISDHKNGLSDDFISALFVNAFNALPSELVDMNKENILNCFVRQCAASSGANSFILDSNKQELTRVPNDNNFYLYDARLLGPLNSDNGGNLRALGTETVLFIHEYGHYLDSAIYPRLEGTKQGFIDTRGFYMISFNGIDNSTVFPIYGRLRLTFKPGLDTNAFADNYAMSHGTVTSKDGSQQMNINYVEDFAESFATYVADGKDFREKASHNEVLRMKYDWLKNNVFHGVEYDTDIPRIKENYNYIFNGELKKL